MAFYFKKSKRLYIFLIFLSFLLPCALWIALSILFPQLDFAGALLFYVLLFFNLLASATICNTIAVRENKKLLAPLMEQCDPGAFVSVYAPFVFANHVPFTKIAPFVVNVCEGYMEKGDYALAAQTLPRYFLPENKPVDAYYNGCLYGAMAKAAFYQNNLEMAGGYLQSAKLALGRTASKTGLYQALSKYLTPIEYELFYQQIGYDIKQRQWFWETRLLEQDIAPCHAVRAHWNLAKLFSEAGDSAKAAEHAHFVTEHGNKLSCVPKARELLAAQEQEVTR